ncbi:MAG: glycosyltransferase family 4 protein [Candidatus Dormibacteraeota bacterium]|nr:glycosyltransferase family 4 protein [Candidatus Dormibacteraeota bacterium]
MAIVPDDAGVDVIAAVDGTPALRPQPSGTEVYARQVIEALAAARDVRTLRVYGNAAKRPDWLSAEVEWRGIPFPRLWTHWRFRQALHRDAPDVVFVPSHVIPIGLRLPAVVTIHDVGHRRERSAYRPTAWWYLELMTRSMARRARRLIAVSQSTATDLQRFYHVPSERIVVVHSGIDPRMVPPTAAAVQAVIERYQLPHQYYLYLGRNHPRKNLGMLRRAFADARRRGLTASLVMAGPGHEAAPPADGVQTLSYVPAEDLPALYGGALALTLPSRFEGFGFPVLEAMQCGTAVLASEAGALPEIVGSAGILLSPDDPGAWGQAMLELSHDVELQRRLITAGAARSATFSWERAATQIWRVLDDASRPTPARQAAAASR